MKITYIFEAQLQDSELSPEEKNTIKQTLSSVLKYEESTIEREFVGMFAIKNTIYSFLPKTFLYLYEDKPLSDECKRKYTRLVYQSLQRYKMEQGGVAVRDSHNIIIEPDKEESSVLGVVEVLIQDWFMHGLWKPIRSRKKAYGNGTVHWGRTISQSQAVVLEYSSIHHPMIHNHWYQDEHHPLTRIQQLVMKDIQKEYGWLFPEVRLIDIDIRDELTKDEKEWAKAELSLHLPRLFNQRERDLFEWIGYYLDESAHGFKGTGVLLGTVAFDTIFEKMLQKYLNDKQGDFTEVQKKPTWDWNWDGHKARKEYSGGIADTIIPFDGDNRVDTSQASGVLVLDAKYYSFERCIESGGKEHKLPALEDVRKQYFYAQLILDSEENSITTARNTFVFPLSEQGEKLQEGSGCDNEKDSNFYKLGSVQFEQSPAPIMALGISLAKLMEEYTKRNELDNKGLKALHKMCAASEITKSSPDRSTD